MLRFATIFTALVVGFAPLMLGGNQPILWALNAVGAGSALVLTAVALATPHGRQVDLSPAIITPASVGWLFLVLWIVFQLVPWSAGELGHPVWRIAESALDEKLASRISVDLTATKLALLRLLVMGSIFLTVYCLARQRENAALLLGIMVGFFCFYAAYGLIRVSFEIDRVWWFPVDFRGNLTSTFINPNTAATYLGLGVLTVTALLARSLSHTFERASSLAGADRRDALVGVLTKGPGWLTAILLLLLTALLLTASRGGILASIAAMFVLLLLRAIREGKKQGSLRRFAIGSGFVVLVIAIMEVAGGRLLRNFLASGITDEDRYNAMQAALMAARDHLWSGTGAGTFQSVFPLYRPASLDGTGFWSSAHSDYLDALVSLGIPGFGILMFILVNLALRALKGVLRRHRDSHFALIAVSGTVLVGLHGFVDFSLQIQGVAITYVALMGLGVAQSQGGRRG